MFSFFRAIVLHKEAVSVAAFFLHCLTLFFPYLGTLCSCERTHVRSDILLASPPQCPLPFLPLAPFLCFTALSCLSLPSTLVFPLRPPCLFPFSPLAANSLVTPISHFHLILHSLSLSSPSPLMCMLCHTHMILSLFRSLALVGLCAFTRPCCHLLLLLSTTTLSLFYCLTPTPYSLSLWLSR